MLLMRYSIYPGIFIRICMYYCTVQCVHVLANAVLKTNVPARPPKRMSKPSNAGFWPVRAGLQGIVYEGSGLGSAVIG